MPLEQLQKLFEQVGQAAEKLATLKAEKTLSIGGTVALSEGVRTIHDLYRQLSGASIPGRTPEAADIAPGGERTARHRVVLPLVTSLTKEKDEASKPKPSLGESLSKLPPVAWLEAGLKLADYIEKQERAGKAVDGFTKALAIASRFLYSFATGRVILPSGQRVPWRRVLARTLRHSRALRPLRRLMLAPDLILRQTRRHLAQAQGRRVVRPLAETVGRLSRLRSSVQAVAPTRTVAGASRGGAMAARIGLGLGENAAARAAAGGGMAGATAAGGGGGAGVAAAGGGGTAGAGVAAAGGGLLAAAGPVGAAVGAFVALVAVVVVTVVAMRKFTRSVYESADSLLKQRFAKYGQFSPGIAYAEAKYEAYEIRSLISQGAATSQSTLALTEATIQLRREMGPLNKTMLNLQTFVTLILVHVARGVNLLLRLTPMVRLLEMIVQKLSPPSPSVEFPAQTLLRGLEENWGRPRNPPPQGGLPPWQ